MCIRQGNRKTSPFCGLLPLEGSFEASYFVSLSSSASNSPVSACHVAAPLMFHVCHVPSGCVKFFPFNEKGFGVEYAFSWKHRKVRVCLSQGKISSLLNNFKILIRFYCSENDVVVWESRTFKAFSGNFRKFKIRVDLFEDLVQHRFENKVFIFYNTSLFYFKKVFTAWGQVFRCKKSSNLLLWMDGRSRITTGWPESGEKIVSGEQYINLPCIKRINYDNGIATPQIQIFKSSFWYNRNLIVEVIHVFDKQNITIIY